VVISVEDWAEIRRLHRAEQMPVRAIARNTVRRAIADDAPPKYQRAPKGSIVDAVEPQKTSRGRVPGSARLAQVPLSGLGVLLNRHGRRAWLVPRVDEEGVRCPQRRARWMREQSFNW
jgi:hypothetical protein